MADTDYLAAWHQVVLPLAAEFHPDLVSITSINNIIISISIPIISINIVIISINIVIIFISICV